MVLSLLDLEEIPGKVGLENLFPHYGESVAWKLVLVHFNNKTKRNLTCIWERRGNLFLGRVWETQADKQLQAWEAGHNFQFTKSLQISKPGSEIPRVSNLFT